MALTLVVETGVGLADANSYASVAQGTSYHEGHLYATAWTGASAGTKEAALVMATRLIDAFMVFNGKRATDTQALQWPRYACPDRNTAYGYFSATAVPADVAAATIETARALIIEDRTANPAGEGLKFSALGDLQQTFDKSDRRPVIPRIALAMLAKFGTAIANNGSVSLVRA